MYMCESVYLPQPQIAQVQTNLRTRFHTWPRHSAAPALVGALQDSTKRRDEERE